MNALRRDPPRPGRCRGRNLAARDVGQGGNSALCFGLPGTGKTTLSADPKRSLIGDDEHGWSDEGITENARGSCPLEFIANAVPEKKAGHPKNIIFLTCDAQGVLPPIARLTPDQALYQFISGYTSKIAGTEAGLGKEPELTFSACFGGPFMVHHPAFYADLLKRKIERHGVSCWLLNTGWVGGPCYKGTLTRGEPAKAGSPSLLELAGAHATGPGLPQAALKTVPSPLKRIPGSGAGR